LKAAKVTPFLLTYKDAWIDQLFLPLTFGAFSNTSNKGLLDKMNKGTGSFKEISGMFDIIDLVNANGTSKGMDIGGDDGCAEFAQGKAAMWVQGPWYAESIKAVNKEIDFGVAPLPVNDDPNATMINLSVSTTLVLSKYSKNKDVSKALLNYMLDDNDSNAFYQSMSFNPVAKNHTFTPYPWVQDAMAYVKQNKSYQDPVIPQAVKDESGKILQSYYLKSVTKDDVIKDLDKTWVDSVKQ
jgi:raffinose/stachyose/melibiose transport system substrate-binding protein